MKLEDLLNSTSSVKSEACSGAAEWIPFYSKNTLEREHILVKELSENRVVYIHNSMSAASIGTRGLRPPQNDTPGMRIEGTLYLSNQPGTEKGSPFSAGKFVISRYYGLSSAELLQKIIEALKEYGIDLPEIP